MIADDFARQSRSVVIALAAYRISRSEIIALAFHRASQAHPVGFRQVYDRRMHELPHALPTDQVWGRLCPARIPMSTPSMSEFLSDATAEAALKGRSPCVLDARSSALLSP